MRTITSLLALLLLSSTLLPGAAEAATPKPKLHPSLQAALPVDPTHLVRVIVQTNRNDVKPKDIAALVPGLSAVDSFGVIPAFVADVPAGSLAQLASLANVRYVSPDSPVQVVPAATTGAKAGKKPVAPKPTPASKSGISSDNLVTNYPFSTGATQAWSGIERHIETGANVTVAEIDSGVDTTHPDLAGRVMAVNVNQRSDSAEDGFGHGTHVAGIINGRDSSGQYLGIAPDARLISVKVADSAGNAYESDLLRGLDWVYVNAPAYHIRALNLSVSVTVPESYATSPIDAAVERLWVANVTVVAASGNLGADQDAVWYAPGNDPLILTVGCLDDNGTVAGTDDSLCPISSRGVTEDGFAKPDLVAPGRKIVSALAPGSVLASEFPDRLTSDGHIRLSGTSMAAPMVTGAVALLLNHRPDLTPGQIKQILTGSAARYPGQSDGAGALNIVSAMLSADHPPATKVYVPVPVSGIAPARGSDTVLWDGARWSSAYFDGARWSSDTTFDGARWSSAYWDGARWSASSAFDGARWSSDTAFDGARWSSSTSFDGARWSSSTSFDGARWSSDTSFDGARWSSAATD